MLPVWGAYIWRGLFSEFYGMWLHCYVALSATLALLKNETYK